MLMDKCIFLILHSNKQCLDLRIVQWNHDWHFKETISKMHNIPVFAMVTNNVWS